MSPFVLAIIISFILVIVVGFVWYSPALFGKTWMRIHGVKPDTAPKMKGMGAVMATNALVTLVYVIAFLFLLAILIPVNAFSIFICALAIYVGFTLPLVAQSALWSSLPKRAAWQVFGITASNQLVNALIIGIVFMLVR